MTPNTHILLPYQQRWMCDTSQVKIAVKSRRTGITYASACESVEICATGKGNVLYISYKEALAKEFISAVKDFIRVYALSYHEQVELIQKYDPETGDSDNITSITVTFSNGCKITGLSGAARSLRGQGRNVRLVVIDEFAFLDQPQSYMDAAVAITVWGSRIAIISTPLGKNAFYDLCESARTGALPYSLHEITLQDALNDGLYERICLVSGQEYSLEKEIQWRDNLILSYGRAASQELFCSFESTQDALFKSEHFAPVESFDRSKIVKSVRGWDLAGTQVKAGKDPDYTVGVLGHLLQDGSYVISDIVRLRESPLVVRDTIISTARRDGTKTTVGLFTDPGAAGIYVTDDLKNLLKGFTVNAIKASKSKIDYAQPVSVAAEARKIKLLRGHWNSAFITELCNFPTGKHDDQVDALSRTFMDLQVPAFKVEYKGTSAPGSFGNRSLKPSNPTPW